MLPISHIYHHYLKQKTMDKLETFDGIVNRIKDYEQAITPPGVPLRHMNDILKEAAEQYAAQQVQEAEQKVKHLEYVLKKATKHEAYLVGEIQSLETCISNSVTKAKCQEVEKHLAEVTRQRDEAIRWAISFRSKGCPDPLQESFDWFMHTISQLENEKKDGE